MLLQKQLVWEGFDKKVDLCMWDCHTVNTIAYSILKVFLLISGNTNLKWILNDLFTGLWNDYGISVLINWLNEVVLISVYRCHVNIRLILNCTHRHGWSLLDLIKHIPPNRHVEEVVWIKFSFDNCLLIFLLLVLNCLLHVECYQSFVCNCKQKSLMSSQWFPCLFILLQTKCRRSSFLNMNLICKMA